ncbi:LPXTG cell wall anchor domain-containing protein [Kitasatospora sp. NPDC101183]|uniref:LPXTG cell wall anchor domain-containing protein n=1 Tax=Kitasatospora sp. NPDC101183 TaxID=3364100 RepID=UPI0037F59366
MHRRILAVAAAATLVSGLALTSASVAFAAPVAPGPTAPAPQGHAVPVTVTVNGFPATARAGSTVEFTATLKNTADHQVEVPSTGFAVAAVGPALQQSQLKLEFQRPGGTQWQDAKVNNNGTGGFWQLDEFATQLHLAPGAEAVYRLRLTFAADAAPGQASANFSAVVSDPALPVEQRGQWVSGGTPNFTIEPVGGPTTPATAGLPDVKVEGVPDSFTAGGEAKPFKAVYTNRTGKDLRIVPAIVFQGEGVLRPEAVKLEFQTQTGQWLPGTPAPDGDIPGTQLGVDLSTGNKDTDVIALPNGETRTVNLRLAFTKDAPVAAESVFANGYSLPGPGEREAGTSSPKAAFKITAGGGSTPTTPTTPATTAPSTPPATDPTQAPVVSAAQTGSGGTTGGTGGTSASGTSASGTSATGTTGTTLASTGGDSSSAPMAITGATAIALGAGTLVLARRRRAARG